MAGDLLLQKNVIILNDESIQFIKEDNQQITFNSVTPQIDSIKEGTVIVGTKVENEKIRNILAKVVAVSKMNNHIVYKTESAKLEEVIFSGNISGIYDPTKESSFQVNGRTASYIPIKGFISQATNTKINNLEITRKKATNTISFSHFSFDKTINLPSQQVGPVTAAASFNLKGGFTPKIKYNISFSFGHLSSYYIDFIMDDISLQTLANVQGKLGYTLSVTDYLNIPIVPIVLGPTGLIISPSVAAGPFVAASSTGIAQINLFAITGKANFKVGLKPDLNLDFQLIKGPQITKIEGDVFTEAGFEIKGAVGLQFLTASIANSGLRGRVSAMPSLKLELIPNRSIPFELKAKLQADMFYGFGISPLRYEGSYPLLDKELVIYKTRLL